MKFTAAHKRLCLRVLLILLLFSFLGLLWSIWLHWQNTAQYTSYTPPAETNDSLTAPEADLPDTALPDFHDLPTPPPKLRPAPPPHVAGLIDSVYEQSRVTQRYDPSYVDIAYPGGDVDPSAGVCTDVIVRAFRAQDLDLQKAVHEDMRRHFKKYPQKWGLKRPDSNIDHRRVPNLMTYFERQGKALPVRDDPEAYKPGDIVVWELDSGQLHIGIVMKSRSWDEERPLIGHNINAGTQIEDVLFNWPIIAHYRWFEPLIAEAEAP